MWIYEQSSGNLRKDEILVAQGYSGFGPAKNDPVTEVLGDVGVIPQGLWDICGPPYDTMEHGPYVLRLEPHPTTQTFGRTGFLIHGDSAEHPGQASRGCIILDKETRSRIWQSGDYRLTVLPGIVVADLSGEISV